MKKRLVFLMLITMFVSLAYASLGFKIGVVTGTVSQGEDEYRGAENVIKKYGSDIIHVIYPDNFMQEQETTIARIVELAYDPSVKAIVICQAVPGTVAAIRKVKEFRPDIVFVAGTPHEDPPIVERVADVSFNTDDERRGITIIDLAHKMGAKTFIHYSFPRHLSMELIARRKDLMEQRCKDRHPDDRPALRQRHRLPHRSLRLWPARAGELRRRDAHAHRYRQHQRHGAQ